MSSLNSHINVESDISLKLPKYVKYPIICIPEKQWKKKDKRNGGYLIFYLGKHKYYGSSMTGKTYFKMSTQ